MVAMGTTHMHGCYGQEWCYMQGCYGYMECYIEGCYGLPVNYIIDGCYGYCSIVFTVAMVTFKYAMDNVGLSILMVVMVTWDITLMVAMHTWAII